MLVIFRLGVTILTLCSLLVIGAIVLGSDLSTTSRVHWTQTEDTVYVNSVEDAVRAFDLWLGGTRCYPPFPSEHYVMLHENGLDVEIFLVHQLMTPAEMILELAC